MRSRIGNERGTALLAAVLVTVILSMLGTVSLNLATQEIVQTRMSGDEAIAQNLADAGLDVAISWFHDPASAPDGAAGSLLTKRFDLPESGPSFLDSTGQSQFRGTSLNPDILYDASRAADDQLLNGTEKGWFRSLRPLGRILKLKVYGPARPGLLCTVEVTAGTGNITRTVATQLGSRTIPPLRAGVQINTVDPKVSLPLWLHWGSLKINGDVYFGKKEEFPAKSQLAAVTNQSYAGVSNREDRWLEAFIGGDALFAPSSLSSSEPPANVYPHQNPTPGLRQDRWEYETMKKYAMAFGTYYARDQDGLLYRNGVIQPGLGLTADQVFESKFVGDHHGLIFIDTLDQLPPQPDNLGTISISTEYAEGLFVVNAHLHLHAKGPGKSVPALSPPREGSTSLGSRIPVELSNINLQGVLYVAGDFSFEEPARVYGALITEGRALIASENSTPIEIWYNYDLRNGLFRGLPLVYAAPGTWQQKY
ncbi:MAG TPA: hypothetical protein VJ692_14305 [Nitrospiraceae bacterium]|nr:hypothetical protein [Nitrospiraceae bacterium]